MSVMLDAIAPQVLQVGLLTLPAPISDEAARDAFTRLAPLGYDSYRTLKSGTVIGASGNDERRLMLTRTSRIMELPVASAGLQEALGLAVATVDILAEALPKPEYTAIQIGITSHIPVQGEPAAAAMLRVVPRDPEALQPLGNGTSAGLRIFLPGTSSVVIEPNVGDPTTIFLQYVSVSPQEGDTIQVEVAIRTALEFQNGPVRETLNRLFRAR
jgi:hypothetical protein